MPLAIGMFAAFISACKLTSMLLEFGDNAKIVSSQLFVRVMILAAILAAAIVAYILLYRSVDDIPTVPPRQSPPKK